MTGPTAIVLGTRPEIIKLSPVIRACDRRDTEYLVVHTGQHYSEKLDSVFFDQLELPVPDYNLEIGSESHGQQTGEMVSGVEAILLEEDIDTLLLQGDTNSVLAGAIAASKLNVNVGHVEAGLRSYDKEMPEEINRILTDHVSDYLFAPTEQSAENLLAEGINDDRVYVTGNTVVDAVEHHASLASEKSDILEELSLVPEEYILLTAHRATNVDTASKFRNLLRGVAQTGAMLGLDVVYPIHPRAEEALNEFGLTPPEEIMLVEPQDYFSFLKLQSHARLICTDSGGIQEEACILGVPCVTLRENTERPETVDVGANMIVGTDPEQIRAGAAKMKDTFGTWDNPFGSGDAAEQILSIVFRDQQLNGAV